jgi:predicted nucleic acid-binding protein
VTPWVLDATVLMDASRARSPRRDAAVTFLERAAGEGELWSVTPVRTQVGWLMRPEERGIVYALLDRIFWLDVTTELADRAAAYGARYAKSHRIDTVDALVAAATEELSGRLATDNVRHFPMFPGLRPPY